MNEMPSAEQVAWAIVAACRETGENPLAVAGREQRSPARHYALQSLKKLFPAVKAERLAFLCGCSGKPEYYAVNSTNGMSRFVGGPYAGERKHRFFKEDAFARVIAAIKAVAPDQDETPRQQPIKLSAKTGGIVEPMRPAANAGKRKLEDMLREAVQNTQAMTPPPEN